MFSTKRNLLLLSSLTAALCVSSAWAGEAGVQGEAARALRRAEDFVQQARYKQACAEFERASELAGGACPDCLLGVGRAYSGAGQLDAAIQVTRMAIPMLDSAERQARGYDQLGSLLAMKGELNAAREAFGKAVQLDGRMAEQVRASLADALLKRATYAEAAHRAQMAGSDEIPVQVQMQAP
jgi:tetratricopeptide (TPR) repeat protein